MGRSSLPSGRRRRSARTTCSSHVRSARGSAGRTSTSRTGRSPVRRAARARSRGRGRRRVGRTRGCPWGRASRSIRCSPASKCSASSVTARSPIACACPRRGAPRARGAVVGGRGHGGAGGGRARCAASADRSPAVAARCTARAASPICSCASSRPRVCRRFGGTHAEDAPRDLDWVVEARASALSGLDACAATRRDARLKSRPPTPTSLDVALAVRREITIVARGWGSFDEAVDWLATGRVRVDDLVGRDLPARALRGRVRGRERGGAPQDLLRDGGLRCLASFDRPPSSARSAPSCRASCRDRGSRRSRIEGPMASASSRTTRASRRSGTRASRWSTSQAARSQSRTKTARSRASSRASSTTTRA